MMELNGTPVTAAELSSLALCNYGHFTSMRVEDGRVRGLDLHLARLRRDCDVLFGAELDTDRVRHLARRIATTADGPVVVRITVFDPDMQLARPAATGEPRILVTARPGGNTAVPAVRFKTVRYERELARVKHVGLFGTLHHRRRSQLEGYDDVLFADADSRISEAATSNIAFVRDDRVRWPQAECLPGVTMDLVQNLMRRLGVHYDTEPTEVEEIPEFHSAFITNAAVGIRSVAAVDRTVMTEATSLLAELRREYAAIVADPL